MPQTDPRIDAYIDKAADFAKPVLSHLRTLVHDVCPDAVESIKWSFPHFSYKDAILCSMAAFKNHAAFTIWRASLLDDPGKVLDVERKTAMGHLGTLKGLSDLPKDAVLKKLLKQAMMLKDEGAKLPPKPKTEKKELEIPEYFTTELNKNKKAQKTFEAFAYSHKKEYLEWITEAKTDATRNKRIATTLEWLEEGKDRNWAYRK